VQHITHSALEWFGKILGTSWKQSKAAQTTAQSDDPGTFFGPMSLQALSEATQQKKPVGQSN
jgi:hypothetical protein